MPHKICGALTYNSNENTLFSRIAAKSLMVKFSIPRDRFGAIDFIKKLDNDWNND